MAVGRSAPPATTAPAQPRQIMASPVWLGIMNASHNMNALIQALREGKLDAVRAAIGADPEVARQGRAVVAAGGRAMQPALALLKKAGADLNACWRNYRAAPRDSEFHLSFWDFYRWSRLMAGVSSRGISAFPSNCPWLAVKPSCYCLRNVGCSRRQGPRCSSSQHRACGEAAHSHD